MKEITLICIDSLFDSLFGCVTACSIEWTLPLIENNYITRNHNTLSILYNKIKDNDIKNTFKNRDVSILKLSKRTKLCSTISDNTKNYANLPTEHPEYLDISFVINTYPYNFTKEELLELLSAFKEIFGVNNIKRIHLPVDKLGPAFLSKYGYTKLIVHDFNEWVLAINNEFYNTKIPDIIITAPIILMSGFENKEVTDEFIKAETLKYNRLFALELLSLEEYSIDIESLLKSNGEEKHERI